MFGQPMAETQMDEIQIDSTKLQCTPRTPEELASAIINHPEAVKFPAVQLRLNFPDNR
jgi:hypothetical protein